MMTINQYHSFTPIKDNSSLFFSRFGITRNSIACFCKSNDSDQQPPPPEGDARSQELLARIAQLQAQKVRLTGYLDETSEYLTKFGEEAFAEIDKLGEDALKGLDEASERVCFSSFLPIHFYGYLIILILLLVIIL